MVGCNLARWTLNDAQKGRRILSKMVYREYLACLEDSYFEHGVPEREQLKTQVIIYKMEDLPKMLNLSLVCLYVGILGSRMRL